MWLVAGKAASMQPKYTAPRGRRRMENDITIHLSEQWGTSICHTTLQHLKCDAGRTTLLHGIKAEVSWQNGQQLYYGTFWQRAVNLMARH